jgi:hypothetical protein
MFKELFINQINQAKNLEIVYQDDTKVTVLNIEDDFEIVYVFDSNGNLVNTY